jgi:hypothetical protein
VYVCISITHRIADDGVRETCVSAAHKLYWAHIAVVLRDLRARHFQELWQNKSVHLPLPQRIVSVQHAGYVTKTPLHALVAIPVVFGHAALAQGLHHATHHAEGLLQDLGEHAGGAASQEIRVVLRLQLRDLCRENIVAPGDARHIALPRAPLGEEQEQPEDELNRDNVLQPYLTGRQFDRQQRRDAALKESPTDGEVRLILEPGRVRQEEHQRERPRNNPFDAQHQW